MAILRKFWFVAFLLILPLPVFAQTSGECAAAFASQAAVTHSSTSKRASATHGLDLADLDRSVSPCTDFF